MFSWSPLLHPFGAVVIIIFLHSGSAQASRFLRGETIPVSSANVCLTVKQCQNKFQSLKLGGTFYSSSDFLTKGCYTKNNNVYFGIGGTYEEKAETSLVGDLVRVFCDDAVEAHTSSTSLSIEAVTVGVTTINTKPPSTSAAMNQQRKVVCITSNTVTSSGKSLTTEGTSLLVRSQVRDASRRMMIYSSVQVVLKRKSQLQICLVISHVYYVMERRRYQFLQYSVSLYLLHQHSTLPFQRQSLLRL
jgi:hypothetical protein